MASAEALGELETIIMPRRCIRFSLALFFLLSSNAWALGLGEIRLDSALNAPMRAQIELLSASPEELENLVVSLASSETFARYGLDRPYYLQELRFEIVRTETGAYVSIRSASPITEPFLTFLVEATWARGRLLREYTVLLDPPTFAPPAAAETRPAVTAPQRSTPTDSARIERQQQPQPAAREPEPQRRPVPAPAPRTEPRTEPSSEPRAVADTPEMTFDASDGGDYIVQRRETLWGIAARFRPDSRLTMNQTMLAIFEANPDAFGGNINILRAGASLRIPSADDIYRIDRGYALDEARRQHAAWGGMPAPAPTADPVETTTRPSLTLVPPDEEPVGVGTGIDGVEDGEPATREEEILDRIAELEAADVPQQRSLIEIRDNELATLRQELADIRGEIYEPPVDDTLAEDGEVTTQEDLFADTEPAADDAADEVADDTAAADAEPVIQPPSTVISAPAGPEQTLLDTILGYLTSIWTIIGGAVILAAGVSFWFVRRGRGDDDELESWTSAGAQSPDLDDTVLSATESLKVPSHDESIVVVEQESGIQPQDEDTVDAPGPTGEFETAGGSGAFGSLEDTFSSETAVNLDQSDPIAEADFHMAYGLYDQAADLINGALEVEADRLDLLTKLCEIYFVWGNRDAFIDAATRVKRVAGGSEAGEWDKIVIMGQQIAADHELFAGAGVAGATKAVDLSFEAESDEASALDMDFGEADDESGDVIDLGASGDEDIIDLGASGDDDVIDFGIGAGDEAVDFVLEDEAAVATEPDDDGVGFEATQETPTIEASTTEEETAEMPSDEETVETPTIEDQFAEFDATSELPSISEPLDEAIADSEQAAEATAEINLDELGLDLDSLAATEVASLDDIDDLAETEVASLDAIDDLAETELAGLGDELDITSTNEVLEDTSISEALPEDPAEATGKNPEIDPDATGVQRSIDPESTGMTEALDIDEALASTSEMRLAADETGQNPLMQQVEQDTDVGFDESLLEATGRTQILPEDFAVETAAGVDDVISDQEETLLASMDEEDESEVLGDQDATMLAPMTDDDGDFDFAKTEALPKDIFTGNMHLDETGELPAVASTDVDLDLDDLTAALKVSEMGDTVDMPRDDATVEHVRPSIETDDTSEVPTMSLSPDDMSDDLLEARTMTEVGTKLDLARAYVDMGDPGGARSILEEVLDEGDESQRQQAQQLLDSLPG
jgi:pilus assembly protein FimV